MNLAFDENDAKRKRDFEPVVSTDIGISFLGISPSFEGVAVPISPPTRAKTNFTSKRVLPTGGRTVAEFDF